MVDHRVIALPAGPTILRLLPPLILSEDEMTLGIDAIAASLDA
jgi:acetylornithine/LysW-gamma-L-lysine aminotransferase